MSAGHWIVGTSALALVQALSLSGTAVAQTSPTSVGESPRNTAVPAASDTTPPADTTTPTATTAQTQTGESGETDGINDIVVTAQRREETAQRAAVAIDAVKGSSLISAGITGSGQLNKLVPALTVVNGGGSNTSIYMRGVGNRTNSSYVDPAVTISYDGVFLGRPAGAFGAAFFDLSRVEVLKGPQGILYGRNATGGAINIIPNRPELGVYGGGFNVSVGNYDAVEAQAYANIPVGDTVAVRLGAARQVRDGYNRDGSSDQDNAALRAQLLFKPNDDISIRLGADYTRIGGQGDGFTYLGYYNPGPTGYVFTPSGLSTSEGLNTPAANAFRTSQLGAPGFGFFTPMNQSPRNAFTYWGVNGELTARTGIGTITVIPAYRKSDGSSFFYGPAFNTARFIETDEQYSLEARLAGSVGPVDYLAGGFFFHEEIDSNAEYNQEFVLPIQRYDQKTRSLAAFGQLTLHPVDRVRLVGGARYTADRKSMDGLINNFITFCGSPAAVVTPPASFARGCAAPNALPRYPNALSAAETVSWLIANNWIAPTSTVQTGYQVFPLLNGIGTILKTYDPVVAADDFSRLTWKASAEFDAAPNSLLYATVETGYRAGGFQLAEGRPRYRPEYITAYTIGSKNRFFHNRVQLNVEAFYWRYRDQQISYFTVDTSGTLINSTENAGRVSIKGVDVDAIVKPFARTTLSGKVQYLDATYKDLHLFTAAPRDNFNCPFTLTGQLSGGAPVKDFNCSGRQAQYSPRWTLNLAADQTIPLDEDTELAGRIATSWRSSQYGGFEYLPFELIPAYWQTDAEISVRRRQVTIAAFVRNLEDKRRIVAPTLAPTGQAVAIFSAPRTYGLRLSGAF